MSELSGGRGLSIRGLGRSGSPCTESDFLPGTQAGGPHLPALREPPYVSMVTPCFSWSPVEGLKVVEIEKCKSDIKKMREELAARSNR